MFKKNKDRIFLYNLRIKRRKYKKSLLIVLISGLFITYLIQTQFYFIYWVKDRSLEPNYYLGDWVLFERFNINPPQRGDIIAFESTPNQKGLLEKTSHFFLFFITLGLYQNSEKLTARRILGLPGDSIMIQNKSIYLNGKLYIPDWPIKFEDVRTLPGEVSVRDQLQETFIPNDHIFVSSDHWDQLNDSRSIGVIPIEKIEGMLKGSLKSSTENSADR